MPVARSVAVVALICMAGRMTAGMPVAVSPTFATAFAVTIAAIIAVTFEAAAFGSLRPCMTLVWPAIRTLTIALAAERAIAIGVATITLAGGCRTAITLSPRWTATFEAVATGRTFPATWRTLATRRTSTVAIAGRTVTMAGTLRPIGTLVTAGRLPARVDLRIVDRRPLITRCAARFTNWSGDHVEAPLDQALDVAQVLALVRRA
jgi:hypothetical protein